MKTASLLITVLSMAFYPAVLGCQVMMNGEDKTDEFFVVDDITGESYVDCMGKAKCREAIISDCPVVKCFDIEACNSAQIINVLDFVLCEGTHSCHLSEISFAEQSSAAAAASAEPQRVSCVGSGACDVAQISGEDLDVECTGFKACRKVHVVGAKLVKCREGSGHSNACDDFATLETKCLYCGKQGCAAYINMCRYKILGEEVAEKYTKCQPESLIGDCPSELEAELELELNGKEEIDGNRRVLVELDDQPARHLRSQ